MTAIMAMLSELVSVLDEIFLFFVFISPYRLRPWLAAVSFLFSRATIPLGIGHRPSKAGNSSLYLFTRLLTFLTLITSANAQTNSTNALEFRTWTFEKGGRFFAKAVEIKGTNVLILAGKDGKQYQIGIPQLVSSDQNLIHNAKRQLEDAAVARRFDAQAKDLLNSGYIELTVKLIENYPEQVDHKKGWMDVEFIDLTSIGVRYPGLQVGCEVRDKNDNMYWNCRAYKEDRDEVVYGLMIKQVKMDDKLAALSRGDKVRLIGEVIIFIGSKESEFEITDIRIIKRKSASN